MCGWVRLQRAVSFSPTARLGIFNTVPGATRVSGLRLFRLRRAAGSQIKSPRNAEWKFTLAQGVFFRPGERWHHDRGRQGCGWAEKSSVGCSASKGYPGSTVPVTGGTPPVSPPDGLVTMTMGVVLRSSSESSGAFEAGILQPDSNRAEKQY